MVVWERVELGTGHCCVEVEEEKGVEFWKKGRERKWMVSKVV